LFSECGAFRYTLTRIWDPSRAILPWCLCNPSTAGAELDDPTSRKGRGFSERLGYGGMVFVNPWAYCATEFADLRKAGFQVGPENDRYILSACAMGDGKVICGWGAHGRGLERPRKVLAMIRDAGFTPMALRLTHDGLPMHPLMLPYNCRPFELPRP
jgi:hypothetical protein